MRNVEKKILKVRIDSSIRPLPQAFVPAAQVKFRVLMKMWAPNSGWACPDPWIEPACPWEATLGAGDRRKPTSFVENIITLEKQQGKTYLRPEGLTSAQLNKVLREMGPKCRTLRQYLLVIHLQKSPEHCK